MQPRYFIRVNPLRIKKLLHNLFMVLKLERKIQRRTQLTKVFLKI
jgi:hypothetical protein